MAGLGGKEAFAIWPAGEAHALKADFRISAARVAGEAAGGGHSSGNPARRRASTHTPSGAADRNFSPYALTQATVCTGLTSSSRTIHSRASSVRPRYPHNATRP